jgi:ribose transport system substrate-binding protein
MPTRRLVLQSAVAALALAALPRAAFAADFHGFDPTNVGPERPTAEALKAMVADAVKQTPPRNGKNYVFGYTMWGGSSPFSQLNKKGLTELCAAAGIELAVADNEWQPQRNVANTQAFAERNVDFVINSLLDIQFASAVRKPLDDTKIPLLALDIPVPGSQWVGVDNARAGFRAGTYLAQAAVKRWGDQAVQGNVVIAAFPLVGPNGKLRNMAQEAGVRSVLQGLAKEQVSWLDMQGTAESGFAEMNNVIGRLDPAKPVLIASFSDEQLTGALRAIAVAGRSDMTVAVGMGGERLDAVGSDPSFIGTMSFFPETYACAAIPTALALLAGQTMPGSVFAYSNLVTPKTVCKADPTTTCRDMPAWQPDDAAIDEAEYKAFVHALHQDPTFTDFQMLLPAEKA